MTRSFSSHPVRPAIPPVLVCALCLWMSCAVLSAFAQTWNIALCAIVSIAAIVASLCVACLLWRMRGTLLLCATLGLLVGVACGCASAGALHALEKKIDSVSSSRMRFEMIEDGTKGAFGSQCVAKAKLDDGSVVNVRLSFDKEARIPRYGDVCEADVSLVIPKEQTASFCWQKGIVATATVRQPEFLERRDIFGAVLSVRNEAIDSMGARQEEGAGVLQALVCGWRAGLEEGGVYEAFKVTGLAHVIAVSGAHLVMVSGLVGAVLKALRVPRGWAVGIQVVLMLCYLVLAAAPISAVRAAVMCTASMTALFARRRSAGLNALGVCIIAMLALDPIASLSVGFALSALSTLGILLFSRLFCSWIETCLPRVPRFANEAFSLTLASSVVVQLLSSSLFSQISLVSPFANVVVAPLIPLVCAGGLIAALLSLIMPGLGGILIQASIFGSDVLCASVRFCAGIPFASIPLSVSLPVAFIGTVVAVVGLWIWWPQLKLRVMVSVGALLAVCLTVYVAVFPHFAGDEIVMLDVGQGDALLIRSKGTTVLLDTGNQDSKLREALARQGISRLDAVITTHADDDHCGSLSSLKSVVQVDRVLLARDALTCSCNSCKKLRDSAENISGKANVKGLSVGDTLTVGNISLAVIWPETFAEEGGNADSLCMLARADVNADGVVDWTTLFTGDAEHKELETLVESGAVGRVDVLKVGHHGSKNALTPELAQSLSPRLALVSSGDGNRYGHPTDKTLQELESAGAQIWRTDRSGDVSCKLRLEGIQVETLR